MLVPVVLSGGAGTRLWPVSREGHPKPFIKLPDGQSLLKKTYLRAIDLDQVAEILTITNRDYYFKSKDEFILAAERAQKAAKKAYMLEPFGRNTAPAIALGAFWVAEHHGGDAVMLVLPADHLIRDVPSFGADVRQALPLARQGKLITFGIPPSSPETGFGYIECGAPIREGPALTVKRFTEKPGQSAAQEFLSAGNYLWNSGMFCFTAAAILSQLERHAPDIYRAAAECWNATLRKQGDLGQVLEIDEGSFADLPDISIDYAVMERSADVAVIPAAFDWNDIGSWNAIGGLVPADDKGNRVQGETVLVGTSNTLIQSEGRVVAAVGVENLVIVDTPDALLVSHQDHVQDVRQVVHHLKRMEHDTYRLHRTVFRPWGSYTVLEEGSHFKIKRLEVKPGASLSLQMHHHRSEHWIVVSGMARVINGERDILVNTNESTYIPAGHRHRLENPGLMDLVMIEVQSGNYLGEDDIVRFDDQYGRA